MLSPNQIFYSYQRGKGLERNILRKSMPKQHVTFNSVELTSPKFILLAVFLISVIPSLSFIFLALLPPRFFFDVSIGAGNAFNIIQLNLSSIIATVTCLVLC